MLPVDILQAFLARGAQAAAELWREGAATRVQTRAGQTLFDVYDPITDVFLVLEGRVILFTGESSPRPLLRLAGPAVCGDEGLLAGEARYSHSARCLETCTVMLLPAEALTPLVGTPAALAWLRDLSLRYQRTLATAIYEASSLEARLWRWLHDTFGSEPFVVPADPELGLHLCVSADRIARARRELVRRGRLEQNGTRARLAGDDEHERLMPERSLIHSCDR